MSGRNGESPEPPRQRRGRVENREQRTREAPRGRYRERDDSEERSRSRQRSREHRGRRLRSPSFSNSGSDTEGEEYRSEDFSGQDLSSEENSEGEENPIETDKQEDTSQKEVKAPENDKFGPCLSKEEMKSMMGESKRVDDKPVTLAINPALVDTFNKKLMAGGKWSRDTWEEVEDKYRLSKEQQLKLEPPTLKGTKLYAAMRDKEKSWDKKYMLCHRNNRHLVKLGLRQYELYMVAAKAAETWQPPVVYKEDGSLEQEFMLKAIGDFKVKVVLNRDRLYNFHNPRCRSLTKKSRTMRRSTCTWFRWRTSKGAGTLLRSSYSKGE